MRLLLIRHAALEGAETSVPLDGDLSEGARKRAAELARWLPRARAVFTSPATCATQTAAAIGLSAEPDSLLGDWHAAEVAGAGPDLASGPPAESFDELCTRVRAWLAKQESAHGTRYAITHTAIVRAAVLSVLAAPAASFEAIVLAPCSVTELGFRGGTWHVARVNWEPTLFHVPQRHGRRKTPRKES